MPRPQPAYHFNAVVTIERRTIAMLHGQPTSTWSAIALGAPARVEAVSAREVSDARARDGAAPRRRWRVFLPASHQVRPTDRLRFADVTARIVDVQAPVEPHADLAALLVEEQPGS